MSRRLNSTSDRLEFENAIESLQITDKTGNENEVVSSAKTIQLLEKTSSKSQPFLLREGNYAPENVPSCAYMNPIYDHKFMEKEADKVNLETKKFSKNTTDLDEDGNSYSIVENDLSSNVDIKGNRNKSEIDSGLTQNVHKTNFLPAQESCTDSSPVTLQPSACSMEEQKCPESSCDYSNTFTFEDEDETAETFLDEPDFFDSDEEFSELGEMSFEEMLMSHYYPSSRQGCKDSSARRDRYCSGIDQYLNFPIFMKSIRKFALDNKFEVAATTSNGNCMFHAVGDQMIINGEFHHTAESMRKTTIRYLRTNPFHSSGSHLESFLSSETWDEYLSRMENNAEWGDHLMLKALCESYNLTIIVFNAFEDDIRQTEITPDNNTEVGRPTAYLGHIGEFHYVSLRPFDWEKRWPYNALIQRIYSFSAQYGKDWTQTMIQQRIQRMGIRKYIEEAKLTSQQLIHGDSISKKRSIKENQEYENISVNLNDQRDISQNVKSSHEGKHNQPLLKTYCLHELQLEDNEDSFQSLVEDPYHVDALTGIPMPHFSFLVRHTILVEMINTHPLHVFQDGSFRNFYGEYVGAIVDGLDANLEDCSKTRKMFRFYIKTQKKSATAIFYHRDPSKVHQVDTTDMHPGYCRLKPYSLEGLEDDEICKTESNVYLKSFKMPTDTCQKVNVTKYYAGYLCPSLPAPAMEWRYRKRPFNWPTTRMISDISKSGYSVIQSPHPNSVSPLTEWKFSFSKAEKILISSWSNSQRYAFYILKIIVDYMTSHLEVKLKNKHLKAVFFYACEQIPTEAWDRSLGGCILYLLAFLADCLRKKCISHYFIPSNNIIDYYSSVQIETICVYVEAARLFPIETIQFLVERHGYKYGTKLAKAVFDDCINFAIDRDVDTVYKNIFIPNAIRISRFQAKRGSYEAAYALIKEIYEKFYLNLAFNVKLEHDPPSFMDFLKSALREIRDRTSRLALAKIFDNECGTNLVDCYVRKRAKIVKDYIPFKTTDVIGAIEIPDGYVIDLSSVATYLGEFAYEKYKQGNASIAEAALSVAIKCIKQLLNEQIMDENDIKDESLKSAIHSQRESLNLTLMTYYTHMYWLTAQRGTYTPLSNYMYEIEKHCEDFPAMSYTVSDMWLYLNEPEKSREYLQKAQSFKYI